MNAIHEDLARAATRVATFAAWAIYRELSAAEDLALQTWSVMPNSHAASERLVELAVLAVRYNLQGEALWRRQIADRYIGGTSYDGVSAAVAAAYQVFAATAREAYELLVAEHDRQHPPAPAPARPLAREDSIFEEIDGLGDLVPEAVEAQRLEAARAAVATAPDPATAQVAAARAAEFVGDTVPPIGETPARFAPNRGGRGHKKHP